MIILKITYNANPPYDYSYYVLMRELAQDHIGGPYISVPPSKDYRDVDEEDVVPLGKWVFNEIKSPEFIRDKDELKTITDIFKKHINLKAISCES